MKFSEIRDYCEVIGSECLGLNPKPVGGVVNGKGGCFFVLEQVRSPELYTSAKGRPLEEFVVYEFSESGEISKLGCYFKKSNAKEEAKARSRGEFIVNQQCLYHRH